MKEADYIRTSNLTRIRIISDLIGKMLPVTKGIPLNVAGITDKERRAMARLADTVIERLSGLVEIDTEEEPK
jgi:D-arabinose 5-phosphate isomerase GutQ